MSEFASKKVEYEPVPLDEADQAPRFPTRPRCNDLAWAIVFLCQFATVLIVGLYYFGMNYTGVTKGPAPSSTTDGTGSLHFAMRNWLLINGTFGLILLVTVFGGVFVSILWLYLMKKSPRFIIWFSLIATIVLVAGFTIFFFYKRRWLAACIFLIILALLIVVAFFVESMMAFSIALLEIVIEFLERFPNPLFVAIAFICVQAAWLCLWLLGVVGILYALGNTTDTNNNGASSWAIGLTMFGLAVAFYWTSQVIKNIVHLTTAGTLATWYFHDNDQLPDTPTLSALKRAITSSFGSICVGSLLVAIIRAVRFMVTAAGTHNECLRVCAEFCLSWIDAIVRFFNQYAFTKCALYGFSYCEASKEVWRLLEKNGLLVIINNDLIGMVLAIGSILGGVFGAAFAGGVAYRVDPTRLWVYVVIGFLIGVSLTMCAMEVVDSAVSALIVCFADDPDCLAQTHPAVHQKLAQALNEFYHLDVRSANDNAHHTA